MAFVLPLVVGCSAEAFIPAVPHGLAAGTEILVVGPEDGVPEDFYVFDLAAPQAAHFELPRARRRLEAFVFARTFEQLGIEPGRNTLDVGEAPDPADYTAYSASVSGGDDVTWSTEDAPRWATRLALPAFDARRCLVNGGCLQDGRCKIPCGVEVTPTPPVLPAPPEVRCPLGWTESLESVVEDWPGGALPVRVCRPWPGARPACPPGTIVAVGGACEPIADPCPVDEFPPDAVGVGNLYVRAGAPAGGDGSRDTPFDTVAAALAAVTEPSRIVLGAGVHDVAGEAVGDGVTLVGVCPERASLTGRLVVPRGATAEIRGVTFEVGGIDVRGVATVLGVVFDGSPQVALEVDPRGDATVGALVFSGSPAFAMRVATDATLRGTHVVSTGATPRVLAADGATVDLRLVLVDGTDDLAVLTASSSVTLRESFFDGSTLRFDVSDVALTDVLVTNATRREAVLAVRSNLTATRLHLVDAERQALVARNAGSLVAEDLVVVRAGTSQGRAVATATVAATIERVAVVEAGGDAISVAREPLVTIRDVIVHRAGLVQSGFGVRAEFVRDISLHRAHLSRLGGPGVQLFACANGKVDDLTVLDAGSGSCWDGSGVRIRKGSFAVAERIDLRTLYGRGILVNDGVFELTDGRIDGVRPSEPCRGGPAFPLDLGTGIHFLAGDGALHRFVVENATGYGLRIIGEELFFSTVRASEGIVRKSRVGLETAVVDPDYEAYLDQVDFSDNEVILLESGAAL